MTRRMKRRYLALQVVSEHSVNKKDLVDAVWKALLQLFGEYGASKARLTLIEYNPQKKYAILRCLNDALIMMRASIASITEINNQPTFIYVPRVSGTLKALRKKVQVTNLDQMQTH